MYLELLKYAYFDGDKSTKILSVLNNEFGYFKYLDDWH